MPTVAGYPQLMGSVAWLPMFAMVVWDINTVKKVIEEYRERRVLWNLCDPAYKDNKKKVKIWEDLAKVFNCDVKEIKDKVKNLRTTFHKYRKKKSGSATNEQWIHYNSLTFLLEVDAPKKGLSTEEDLISQVCTYHIHIVVAFI